MTARDDAALVAGDGPTLLVFHGWSGSKHNIERWVPALAPRFRVYAPDLPGCNGVPRLAGRHTAAAYARWALCLLDTLAVPRAYVAGLCSGTAIALALADLAPERVHGLLLHTPFVAPRLIRPAIRAQLTVLASPVGSLFAPLRRSELLAMLHRRLFANASEVSAEQLAHDQADLVRADVGANRELARDLLAVDRSAVLGRWRGPVGVLVARADAFIEATSTSRAVRDLAPQSQIEAIEGGHGWTSAFVRAQHDALVRLAAGLR